MIIEIEHLSLHELMDFLREQSLDAFPNLQDESLLNMLAEKWYAHAEFCTCRDENQRLEGMIAFYANQAETGMVYIPHVYVSSNYRGKGVFEGMLNQVKSYIKKKQFIKVRLEVHMNNERAQKAYLKAGFTFLPGMGGGGESRYMELLV